MATALNPRPGPALLPTSVIGSHALPSWVWTAMEAIRAGTYGPTDVRETLDDAVNAAIRDQERAGVDVITDGEMRRWYFVQGFYDLFTGLEKLEPLRTQGVYGYDSPPRYRVTDRVTCPDGLGITGEWNYARHQADHPMKVTCPGPLTLTIHMQVRKGDAYDGDRVALAHEIADVVNRELHALVDAGVTCIQLDEPSYSIIPGEIGEWIGLYNRAVRGVRARGTRVGLHVCFGNLGSRPRGKRRYAWMVPALMEADCDELVLEFANREMIELEVLTEVAQAKDVGVGLVDVKSFWVEPAEEVADRVRAVLRHVSPEKVTVVPDCGFFQVPRWLAVQKLRRMVEGVRIVRRELAGNDA